MTGASSIVDSVIFDVARSVALETLRADSFNFVDTKLTTKVLTKTNPVTRSVEAIAAALTLISLLADMAKRETQGLAIYTQGAYSIAGSNGKNTMESTLHIVDAINSNRPALLHWIGSCENASERGWYKNKPGCADKDKEQYSLTHPDKTADCDEYPPYAVAEGGPGGDAALTELLGVGVSLRYVDSVANRSCGSVIYWFAAKCDVNIGGAFAVEMDITDSKKNISRGRWEKGGVCYHPEGFVTP